MRVITGTAKGRRLETLAGDATRPTVERVKEGVFSAIAFEVQGRRVLDLFAGSGQMGIEALSRGAASCLFVDSSREAVAVITRNLRATALADRATVLCDQAPSVLARRTEIFDLVFLDPPYADGVLPACLDALQDRVAVGGAVLCESDRSCELPEQVGGFTLQRTYRYGRVVVRLYRKER